MDFDSVIKEYRKFKISGVLPDQMTDKIVEESLNDEVNPNFEFESEADK